MSCRREHSTQTHAFSSPTVPHFAPFLRRPSITPQELDVLLATEDNTVREEAAALLTQTAARVASERLTGLSPSGAQLYEHEERVDGHAIRLSAVPPLRTLLSTPELPPELLEAIPQPKDGP